MPSSNIGNTLSQYSGTGNFRRVECNGNILENGVFFVSQVVSRIAEDSFRGCTSLTNIFFEANSACATIENHAFQDATALEQVVIPASITHIGANAFSGVYNVTIYIEYGSSLNYSIGMNQTFYGGSSIRMIEVSCHGGVMEDGNLDVPYFIGSLGSDAFANCSDLHSVSFASDTFLESIPSGAFRFSDIMSVLIPPSIERIGANAFMGCKSLKRVYMDAGSSLKSIGSKAFYGCSGLTNVGLPVGLTSIGNDAFYLVGNLSAGVISILNMVIIWQV